MRFIKTLNKYIKEGLTEDQIMNDTTTSYEEKESLKIKLSLDNMNEYRSKKSTLENMFSNLDKDIDNITVGKITKDNRFLKDYTQLLYKKRDKSILSLQIERKEEEIKEIRTEITNNRELSESEIDSKNKDISNLESEINDLEDSLNGYKDIDNYLKKWDEKLIKIRRELEQGNPLVISNLLHFK